MFLSGPSSNLVWLLNASTISRCTGNAIFDVGVYIILKGDNWWISSLDEIPLKVGFFSDAVSARSFKLLSILTIVEALPVHNSFPGLDLMSRSQGSRKSTVEVCFSVRSYPTKFTFCRVVTYMDDHVQTAFQDSGLCSGEIILIFAFSGLGKNLVLPLSRTLFK